jgi:riboflavin synthase
MFTGIIQAIGKVETIQQQGGDVRLSLNTAGLELNDSDLGDSIAVNGVCLTAVEYTAHGFTADVSRETLQKTSLGALKPGSPVNLEKALTLSTPLGGHLVSGHVDGLGRLESEHGEGRSIRYEFTVPRELARYIAEKGSVTIDGTSLTVNEVDNNRFGVNIVPHTRDNTIFQYYEINTQVNIEVDIIARYLERLLSTQDSAGADNALLAKLAASGFIKP